jgi:hypothetical protein
MGNHWDRLSNLESIHHAVQDVTHYAQIGLVRKCTNISLALSGHGAAERTMQDGGIESRFHFKIMS